MPCIRKIPNTKLRNKDVFMNILVMARSSFIIGLLFLSVFSAQNSHAKPGHDWVKILGTPPEDSSVEEQEDYNTLMNYQVTRTDEECELASKEEKVSLKNFFGGKDGPLTKKEVRKLRPFFLKYFLKAGIPSMKAKNHFKRPRPFVKFEEIEPCVKRPAGKSFPSGHASVSRIMAYALSFKFPKRAKKFFKRANAIAKNRMLGGVHYPSDIRAGKKLADYLAAKFFKNKKFMNELLGN